jgi:hypothetical protein
MRLTSVEVTPNDSGGLESPLLLQIGFTTDEVITNVYWELTYLVDIAAQRKSIQVLRRVRCSHQSRAVELSVGYLQG